MRKVIDQDPGVLRDIRSMNLDELLLLAEAYGQPSYRASQLFTWIHRRGAQSYDEMTDLPRLFRDALRGLYPFSSMEIVEKTVSKADNATKYLFDLKKNTIIECVFMRHGGGSTLCVSTQAGCRMGCAFCASGAGGLDRSLTAGEICAQLYMVSKDQHTRIDRIVMMGCGEPLDNFGNSVKFINLVTHPNGYGLGGRHITLSTCGLVPKIDELAQLNLQINLAVSLHAPDDSIRKRIMPIARKYSVHEVTAAAKRYAACTNRRVTFEYALIENVNDSVSCARQLAVLLKGILCHVNIIPVNAASRLFARSRYADAFSRVLEERGVPVSVRKSLGGDIAAACGQLRGRHMGFVND